MAQDSKHDSAAPRQPVAGADLVAKFAAEKETTYQRWVRDEGLDIIPAHFVPNLKTVELKPWARRGGRGVFINHEASRTTNDCYVCEIPPGGKLAPHRQLFEEMVFILEGRGSTTVWNDLGAASGLAPERPAEGSRSSGRPARCSASRSTPTTSISTRRARRPYATSP